MADRDLQAGRGLLGLFTRHRTLANIVLMVMVVTGLYAIPNLRAQFFPDTVVQNVNISVRWPGAGAEDVDRSVVSVLEPSLMGVEGVSTTTARSTEGAARISLEFEPGWDMSRGLADIEAALASTTSLPEDAEEPEITRAVWRDGVADVIVSGPVGLDQLGRFADDLLTRLYARGITRASVTGLAAPDIEVEVSQQALMRHDIDLADVAAAIGAGTSAQPAGDVSSGAARVRAGTEARDLAAIAALPLRAAADGTALTVGDVAELRQSGLDRSQAFYVGSDPAVMVRVERSAAGDAIAMQREVEAALAEMRPTLPAGVEMTVIRARAEMISGRLKLLVDNAALGLGLVLALLFLFLNARTAFWVAVGIPAALLAALAGMYATGMTLNMISLFALILTLGIIVDDAIVVGEHADFRARRLGEGPYEAAENAARRMAAPVVSSTLTTVLAFAGLLLIGGRFGNMIADIPQTVIIVLLASLVECFLVLPAHMAHALRSLHRRHWYDAPSTLVNRWLDAGINALLRPLIATVLRLRYPALAGVLAIFAWAVSQLMTGAVPWRFFDSPEQGSVTGNFAMLPGATRDDTMRVMLALQDSVERVSAEYEQRYGSSPTTSVLAQIGGNVGRPLPGAETKDADQLGGIQIELIDPDFRSWTSFEFVADLQAALPTDPRLEVVSFRGMRSGPGGDAISVQLSGADAQRLKDAAETLKARLAVFPEVSALEDNMSFDKEELAVELTPQGRALGFTTEGLAREMRQRLAGIEAATWPVGPRTATVTVTLPEDDRRGDFLDRMMLRANSGQFVPLADIVSVDTAAGFSTIRRENGVRVLTVTGDLAETDPARAAEITAALQAEILPEITASYGVTHELTGLAEQERAFLSEAVMGFALAMTGIYLVLAWIFASWTRPLVVMAVIPFGLIGAVWGHSQWGLAMSMFSVVGLIGMSGIIINDSIVLISTVDEYGRARGLRPAIIDAVCDRFRPVLLTTATTVLGLAPLLYERSSQALFLKPTVVSLAYGLGFGMLVVLLVVPAALGVGSDMGQALRGLKRAARPSPAAAGTRLGLGVVIGGAVGVLAPPLLASLGVPLPGWWPRAAGAGEALALYLALVLAAAVLAAAWTLGAGVSPGQGRGTRRGPVPSAR